MSLPTTARNIVWLVVSQRVPALSTCGNGHLLHPRAGLCMRQRLFSGHPVSKFTATTTNALHGNYPRLYSSFCSYHSTLLRGSRTLVPQGVDQCLNDKGPGSMRSLPSIGLVRFAKKAIVKEKKGGKSKLPHLMDEEILEVIDIHHYRHRLQEVVDKLRNDYVQNLSIERGSASRLENLHIEYEGDVYELNQLATISFKNPQVVVINLANFPECIKPTLKAIQGSGMDVTPQQDGTVVYIHLPKITREHRENLAKNAKSLFNKAKEEIRDVQNRFLKEASKAEGVKSDDLVFNVKEYIKAFASEMTQTAEKMMKDKQKDLLGDK